MRPRVAICGSYHRDPLGLIRIFRELESNGCRILSPMSIDFTDINDPIVRSKSETEFSADELEKYHLRAIAEADFVWVYAPNGYLGLSAAFEIGYCKALGRPIFVNIEIQDEMLKAQTQKVTSVFDALEILSNNHLAHEP